MKEKIRCIVLGRHKHNDRTDIVNVYSCERGRLALAVSSSATKQGRMRRAMLMPLSVVEIVAQGTGELLRPSQISVVRQFSSLYSDPYKTPVAFFLCDFLGRILRDSPADSKLWDYIVRSLEIFDVSGGKSAASFHLVFLSGMTVVLGICPDLTYADRPGAYFDMRSGSYMIGVPMHRDVLVGSEARLPVILSRMRYDTAARWRLGRTQRRELLEGILRYYALHYPGVERLRTLDVLRSVFD